MINKGWNWQPLGELFEISAGKTMSAAARNGIEKTPFLRTSNVFWDEIDLTTLDEMSIPPHELKGKKLCAGDLLVCEGGEIGRAAIWNGEIETISFQNHLHCLRPLKANIEPRFYVYFLQSAFTQLGIFEGAGNKTTIPNLSRSRLAALNVPCPNLVEQKSITYVLAKIQDAIKKNNNQIALTKELKISTMQTLFTYGLHNEPQKETEIGLVPESWKVDNFSTVREWLQYGTSIRCTTNISNYPVLRIPNIESGRVNSNDLKYCDLAPCDAKKYQLENGDLIFIRTNGVLERLGSCAVYMGELGNTLFASYLIRARLKKEKIEPLFIAYFFSSQCGIDLIAGRATPAADGKYNLNTGTIDSFPIPIPPSLNEQREIIEIINVINKKIKLHEEKKSMLEELFKSILNKLMTGEVRVTDLDLSMISQKEMVMT